MKKVILPNEIILLCDEEEDRRLFLQIQKVHPLLAQVPSENVRTYDQASAANNLSALESAIAPLHQDDRPDWIFCLGDKPVLVAELTKHAYTGDNGLQRFARFAAAAENGVPFIYFGPLSRVRDDELDGGGRPSPRRLTSHLFAGMDRLHDVHGSPQLYVQWKVDQNGLPASLPFRHSDDEIRAVYGELLDLIAAVLFERDSDAVKANQRQVLALASQINARDSEVIKWVDRATLVKMVETPSSIGKVLATSKYFDKGKPDKALAEYALSVADVAYFMLPNGRVIEPTPLMRNRILKAVFGQQKFQKTLFFYTGYKWRSDPHCGALVNMDYRLCRRPGELSPSDRSSGLVVAYPRVSLNPDGEVALRLRELSSGKPGPLYKIFSRRYGAEASSKIASCLDAKGLFGVWKNSTKQARLFRRYADLIILNDGIIIGEPMAKIL